MARLITGGWEIGISSAAATNSFEGSYGGSTAPVLQSTVVRSGQRAVKFDSGANSTSYLNVAPAAASIALGRTYFFRVYLCFSNLPDATVQIVRFYPGTFSLSVRITSGGKLQLWNDTGTPAQIGSDSSATIAANGATWYRVELASLTNTGSVDTAELRLDGTSVASASSLALSDSKLQFIYLGWYAAGAGTNKVFYADDFALNDDQGADQNSWPGSGRVAVLLPVSDNARDAKWTTNAGTTTTLYEAVDNVPPAGITANTTPDNAYLKHAGSAAGSTDRYDANLTSYLTALGDGAEQIDYSGESTNAILGYSNDYSDKVCESFVAGRADYNTVELRVRKYGSPADNLVVEIQSDSAGVPSGTVMGSGGSLAGSGLSGSALEWKTFTIAATGLTPGSTYWIVLSRSGGHDTTNYYGFSFTPARFSGAYKRYSVTYGWVDDSTNYDMPFRLYHAYTSTTVNLVQGVASTGEESGTGAKLVSFEVLSNPVVSSTGSFDVAPTTGAQGTWSSNWWGKWGPVTYAPSVTLGTQPVMRVVRPETASRVASVAALALYAEYTAYDTKSRTVPASAVLKALGLSRTVTATASLSSAAGPSRTVTASAVLRSTLTRTVAATAPLKSTISRQVTATSPLKSTLSRTVGATAALKSTLTRTVTATAPLNSLGIQRSVSATTPLKSLGLSHTVTATAAVKALGLSHTVPASAPLKSLGLQRTVGASAALLATLSRQVTATAPLQSTFSRTVPASAALSPAARAIPTSAALQATLARTVPASSPLQSLGLSHTVSATTALLSTLGRTVSASAPLQETLSRTVTASGVLAETKQRTVTSSAVLQALGLTRTVAASAVLAETKQRTVTSSAPLQATLTRTVSASAVLSETKQRTVGATAPLLESLSRTITASAVISGGVVRAVPTSAALLATLTTTVPASAPLLESLSRTVTATVALAETHERTVPASGVLESAAAIERTVPASAVVAETFTRTVPAGAVLLATLTATVPSSGVLLSNLVSIVPPTAALLETLTRTVPASAVAAETSVRTVPASAVLLVATVRVVPTHASLRGGARPFGRARSTTTLYAHARARSTIPNDRATSHAVIYAHARAVAELYLRARATAALLSRARSGGTGIG